MLNRLTPNDPYMGRAAPLTSKRSILYIYSTNIGTEYFKRALYSPFFSLENAVCFIMLTCLVPVLFTFYTECVLKLKKNNNSGAKGLMNKNEQNQWKNVTKFSLHKDMGMTPCSLVNRYLLLTGIHCLHLQGKRTIFFFFTMNTEATRSPETSAWNYCTTWYTRRRPNLPCNPHVFF